MSPSTHLGDVVEEGDGDLTGDGVNSARRDNAESGRLAIGSCAP